MEVEEADRMACEAETIKLRIDGEVARLLLDRPTVRNALGPAEWAQLRRHVAVVERERRVRLLLLEGSGGSFCAGGDLSTMAERLEEPHAVRRDNLLRDFGVIRAMVRLRVPVVARLDGAVVGAGLALALACDLRIASATAKLGAGFHRVGLTGDFGLLYTLPRTIGPTAAARLLYGGELISGTEAAALGLVTVAVPPEALEDEVARWVDRLRAGPPIAQALTKAGLVGATDRTLDEALAFEAEAQATCSRSADATEGVRAFHERRPPRFEGR
jgi:2-(1,2-epoxy-1,2-dihydrophenyl)acetyl-CoA isomerase